MILARPPKHKNGYYHKVARSELSVRKRKEILGKICLSHVSDVHMMISRQTRFFDFTNERKTSLRSLGIR